MAKPAKKTFAVIGLGRFGTIVTKTLYEGGADVLAIDSDKERINDINDFCTQAVCADAADERVLGKLGIHNFDTIIICVGSDIEASVFITLTCKIMGVKRIMAKAQNNRHKNILEKIGANKVFIPEEEMGFKFANALIKPNVIEIMSLNQNFKMVEIMTPEKWHNKTLTELELRKTEKVAVILVKRGDEVIATPSGDCRLYPSDVLVVAGTNQDITRLSSKATKEVPIAEVQSANTLYKYYVHIKSKPHGFFSP